MPPSGPLCAETVGIDTCVPIGGPPDAAWAIGSMRTVPMNPPNGCAAATCVELPGVSLAGLRPRLPSAPY